MSTSEKHTWSVKSVSSFCSVSSKTTRCYIPRIFHNKFSKQILKMEKTSKRTVCLNSVSVYLLSSGELYAEAQNTSFFGPSRSICEYIDSNKYLNNILILEYSLLIDKILYVLKSVAYLDNTTEKKTAAEKYEINYINLFKNEQNIINNFFKLKVSLGNAGTKIYANCDEYNYFIESMNSSKTCLECNEKFEKQDLMNNKSFEIEDETISESHIIHTEIVKPVNQFLKGSEIFTGENISEYQLSTILPAFNEVEMAKQSLRRLEIEVNSHKPNFGVTDIVKCGEFLNKMVQKIDARNDEVQLMEQLLAQKHFHIKALVYEVYMAPKLRHHPQAVNGVSWDTLKAELWRLHTFSSYPHSAKKSAILLAEAGFVYYGSGKVNDDSVICYFCLATKQNWQATDDIAEVHKSLSHDCPMVTRVASANIPVTVLSNGETLFNQVYSISANVDNKQKPGHNGSMNSIEYDNADDNNTTEDRLTQLDLPAESNINISIQVSKSNSMENHTARRTSNLTLAANLENKRHTSSQPVLSDTQTVSVEINRHSTLPTHTTAGTRVQTLLPNTNTQQTSVTTFHVNQSLQNPSSTTSTTNQSTTVPQGNSQTVSSNSQNTPRATGKGPTYGDLGIITERPKRFEYAVLGARLATFGPWPSNHHLKKEDLADAGFYYAGYGDCARCYYCGGGLRNWEDDDNVLVEHARWFPKCAFMRQTVGQEFIDAVQDLNKNCDRISFSMVKEKCCNPAAFLHLDTKTIPQKQDPAVLTVLDMGYDEDDVLETATIIKEKYGMLSADKLFEKLEMDGKPRTIQEVVPNSQPSRYTSDASKDDNTMKKLKEENSQLRQQTVCKICMDKEVAVVFLPCGHFVSCTDCASAMKDCPVCRKQIHGIVRAFIG